MGRYLVPATMVSAIVALAAASLTVAFVPDHPAWWRAAVQLAVLGGIVPVIYAVNIRIVPVFARRTWTNPPLLRIQVLLAIAGAWLDYLGRMNDTRPLSIGGQALALVAALLFTVNVVRLFKQHAGATPAPPLPYPEQAQVDKIAIRFTRLSGIWLLIGLTIGLATEIRTPSTGRWDLVWAHAMLVGFFLSMASGVSYHVLARWTTRRWRSVAAIRLHYILVVVGLPVMLIALARNSDDLFLVAGPLLAATLLVFLANSIPLALGLPVLSRVAWLGASACLATGVTLGAAFASDPVLGARLRLAHAEINLFGWSGLLISAAGYYLVPRFAGCPLRWTRLAPLQLGMLLAGIVAGASALAARGYGHESTTAIAAAQLLVAGSFAIFAVIVGGTFLGKPGAAVTVVTPRLPTTNGVSISRRA